MPARDPNPRTLKSGPDTDIDNELDPTYRDASYLGTSEDESETVRDLGFIVDDHDDRRITVMGDWQRLDALDTDEPLGTNSGRGIPHEVSLREKGAPREWFATDQHTTHQDGEMQEEDFLQTSMLDADPDVDDGLHGDERLNPDDRQPMDFTDDTLTDVHGDPSAALLRGQVAGVAPGFGTSVAQDLGSGGFSVRDNPLMQPEGQPISGELLSDEALGRRDVDQMGTDEELDELADRGAREEERQQRRG